MEMEFFVKPGSDEEWHEYWIASRLGCTRSRRAPGEPAPVRAPGGEAVALLQADRGHEYRYEFPGGEWGELEGIANRTDYDLTTHAKHSGQDLSYLEQDSGSGTCRT